MEGWSRLGRIGRGYIGLQILEFLILIPFVVGRPDPIPFELKRDSMGLGKAAQDSRVIAMTAAQRRNLDSERQVKETEEQRRMREVRSCSFTSMSTLFQSTFAIASGSCSKTGGHKK
jgi:hypothetical protein